MNLVKRKLGLTSIITWVLVVSILFLVISPQISTADAGTTPKVSKSSLTLYFGYKAEQIEINNLKSDAKISYSSNNNKVAKVSKVGIVTPVSKGTASISVKIKQSGKEYNLKVTVTVKYPYIEFTSKNMNLVEGDSYQYQAKSHGTGADLEWSVSDTSLAKINKSGKLTALKAGVVDVIVTSGLVSSSFSVTISQAPTKEPNKDTSLNSIEKLTDDDCSDITVANGWVYYQSRDDYQWYRVREDGTGREQIAEFSEGMAISDGWIYYTDSYDLFRKKEDGSSKQKLCNDTVIEFTISDGWIYYINMDDGDKIYRIQIDGSKRTKLNDDDSSEIFVLDGWVYYCNRDDDYGTYRIKVDGRERTCMTDDLGDFFSIKQIAGSDGWIYYNSSDCDLYRMKNDGTQKTLICDDLSWYITLSDGWIYYSNGSDDDKLYRIKIDGSERTKINDVATDFIAIADGYVFFSNSDDKDGEYYGKLYRLKID